ncbi:MAG: right-handed parallel beta-helix repeat-containing protein [Patescibacteria group bacterium]|jgi:hypothetical protein
MLINYTKKQKIITIVFLWFAVVGTFSLIRNNEWWAYESNQSINIYVSTTGNNNWSGDYALVNIDKTDGSLATIAAARDKIRQIKSSGQFTKPINVYIKNGEYAIDQTLKFDADDSGTSDTPITYQGYGGETIISGGSQITGDWTKCGPEDSKCVGLKTDVLNNVYHVNIGSAQNFNSLYVDELRATRARTPNEGSFYNILPTSDMKDGFYFKANDINPDWRNLTDIETNVLIKWFTYRHKIASITQNKVNLVGDSTSNYNFDNNNSNRYFLDNVFEGLDSVGEWYYDKISGDLFYWPKDGKNIDQSKITKPRLTNLVDIAGETNNSSIIPGSLTVSHWVKTSSNAGQMYTVGNAAGYDGIRFGLSEGKIAFLAGNSKSEASYVESKCGETLYNDDAWHMISGVFNFENGKFSCYGDGVKVGEINLPKEYFSHSAISPNIGMPPCCTAYSGYMDDLKIYNKALSDDEIVSLFSSNGINSSPIISLDFNDNTYDSVNKVEWHSPQNITYAGSKSGFGKAITFDGTNSLLPFYETSKKSASYINFINMTFSNTDWQLPALGYNDSQAINYPPSPPAISIKHASNIHLQNNKIINIGGNGIEAAFSDHLIIKNNEISDIGYGGIRLGEEIPWQLSSQYNTISDNKIHDIGKVIADGVGVFVQLSKNTLIDHNEIYNTGYSGISLGWDWKGISTGAVNNTISNNHIYNIMQILNDGAGIYFLGNQPGSTIQNNLIHNVLLTPQHTNNDIIAGIYLDNKTTGVLVKNNIVFNNDLNQVFNDTDGNSVENNIYANATQSEVYLGARTLSFRKNILIDKGSARGFFYGGAKNNSYNQDYNLYANSDQIFKVEFRADNSGDNWVSTLSEMIKSLGSDQHSVFVADAQFTDSTVFDSLNVSNPAARNYSLKSTSPAIALGFQNIDMSTVGPRLSDILSDPVIEDGSGQTNTNVQTKNLDIKAPSEQTITNGLSETVKLLISSGSSFWLIIAIVTIVSLLAIGLVLRKK